MRYPNLLWALADRRMPNYRLAHELGTSESRFSRAMRGLTQFSADERHLIAELLGYPAQWLFQQPQPPREESCEREMIRA